MKTLCRTIHPVVRILDEAKGLVEYTASDESIDSYGEVVRADGAMFSRFQKNAPFVDSHDYSTIGNCLGQVVDFGVRGRQVVETVKWAVDVSEMAKWGFQMTQAGYLKAVSIGFLPVDYTTRWDNDQTGHQDALKDLNIAPGTKVDVIYLKWDQMELSACLVGANANAVARAYKAGILDDSALEKLSAVKAKRETANATIGPADVVLARQQAQERFLLEFVSHINQI